MSWGMWTHLLFWLVAALRVTGQSSNVTQCVPDFAWSINSKGQTPCLVASYLESQCGAPTNVDAIPFNTHYLGPTFAQQNQCLCSTVTYSLVSACGGCQGRTFQNWTAWSQFCPTPDVAAFSKPIPDFVVVPTWAFINVTLTDNNFNPTIAQRVLDGSSTALPLSSTSTTPTPSSSSAEPSNSSLTDAPGSSTSSSSHSNNAGAIAGGVVGAIVVLIVIGLIFLWRHVQKKRNAVHRDMAFDSSALVSDQNVTSHTTGNTGYTTFASQSPPVQMAPTPGPYGTPSLYTSPYGSDIGTQRPITPATTGMYTTVSPGPTRRSLESVSPSMIQLGGYQSQPGYKGAPEIS